jgi:hypothetical protein
MRYLGFDLEVCSWPEDNNWDRKTDLGVSCIGLMGTDWDVPIIYYASACNGSPEPRPMDQHELSAFVADLAFHYYTGGYQIVSWNGLQFDFLVLALAHPEESRAYVKFAINHIDPMFEIFCTYGWPVGLNAVAKGLGLPGKMTDGVSGADAPKMWMEGTLEDRQKVLEYVGQDAKTTVDLVDVGVRLEKLKWLSKSGRPYAIPYKTPRTVKECLELPEPDNSWMTDPLTRKGFYDWTES